MHVHLCIHFDPPRLSHGTPHRLRYRQVIRAPHLPPHHPPSARGERCCHLVGILPSSAHHGYDQLLDGRTPQELLPPFWSTPRLHMRRPSRLPSRASHPIRPGSSTGGPRGGIDTSSPLPPIMEEVFSTYETALANLPEKPTPVALPALKAPQHSPKDMDAKAAGAGLDLT